MAQGKVNLKADVEVGGHMSIESKGGNVFGWEERQHGAFEELQPMLGYMETDGGQKKKKDMVKEALSN